MKNKIRTIIMIGTAVWALGIASRAAAISISQQPSTQNIGVGGNAAVNIMVSGLGNLASPSVGAFDFHLSYDQTIVSASSVTFGTFLDLGAFGSIRSSDLSIPGSIQLDEVSLESAGALNAAQPDSFTLATLSFVGIAPGISPISFTSATLFDETGVGLANVAVAGGSITVTGTTAVPDSASTGQLLVLGLLGVAVLHRRISTLDTVG
jgi:hypothetical protein